MARWKVGIVTPRKQSGIGYDVLTEAGCELVYGVSYDDFPGYRYSEEELVERFGDVDGILVSGRDKLPRYFLERARNLRIVSKASIGVEKIDVQAATELGIVVTNAPVAENYIAVAEGTITLMLAILKRVRLLDRLTRAGKWKNVGIQPMLLRGKTVGLIGFGRIGKAVAERLRDWDVSILVYDPYVPEEAVRSLGASLVSLETLLSASDIISNHVVLTPETRHLLNRERLKLLKPTAVVINTSRGEVIEEQALIEALQSGSILAAGLDVFEQEPPSFDHPLFQMEQVIVTPHGISVAEETVLQSAITAAEECLKGLKQEIPAYVVNPQVLERWAKRG